MAAVHMDPNFAIVTAISRLASILIVGIIGWSVVAFTRARRGKVSAGQLPLSALQPLEGRMERLEQTTEAIALQVERIAEGQRFVTKLLSQGVKAEAHLPGN
ncbi:MAG: hypothetical protein ABI229_03725 [Gemmatimonadaceae bacterium]